MAGIIDFSQIFADGDHQGTDIKTRRQCYEVPEPPACTDIPDLDQLLGGDGRHTLLDLQPSQWMPASHTSQLLPSTQTKTSGMNINQMNRNQVFHNTMSERGDYDDVYLGSQFPLVHNIGASQVPAASPRHVLQSQKPTSQTAYKISSKYNRHPERNSVYVLPKKTAHSTGFRTADKRNSPYSRENRRPQPALTDRPLTYAEDRRSHRFIDDTQFGTRIEARPLVEENDSQEDLFEDSEDPRFHTMTDDHQGAGRIHSNQLTVARKTPTDQLYSPALVAVPLEQYRMGVKLRPVTEMPENFRKIFNFPHFNIVQSTVYDDVMYTDKCLVLCSPTGSGKTAVFEMAIVRLMTRSNTNFNGNFKIVYMAPIKALCSERFNDWKEKFEPYGLRIMELTGDTDTEEFYELQQVNIILTTPEKWDSMTRKWRDNKAVMHTICLFLIDEIHVLNDPSRGSVVEAVVSRMKTIQAARQRSSGTAADLPALRFIAISATITNIEDLAEWLGHGKVPAVHYKLDDSVRPVRLRKVVLGYHFTENKQSEFQFDLSLSYKLSGVINTYSDDKPVLIFCATRKSSMQGADILSKDVKSFYVRNAEHRLKLQNISFYIKDTKLRDLVVKGVGYHHAGLDVQDRKLIEEIFAKGDLPILIATSTLAMGVNLPAHLVIIKSTMFYNMGSHQEYPDTQVLQMIGRAGRPQFDTSATAVIMTKNSTKMKYENLLNGTQLIESSLHKNLVEHLNAEIVLNTITDISVAVEWLKYTFLYIRVMKNPSHYGMPVGLTRQSVEKRLQDLCMKSLNQLHRLSLIQMNEENMDVRPTESGRLMARYCISYKTAELFLAFKGDETIQDMLSIISKCEEFEDIKLRNNEKKTLNTLNKDKNRITIRYPMSGKIKTADMKVNCLIQATLGSLLIQDFALQQDTGRIFRAGIRVTRCLVELLSQKNNHKCLLSAILLCKCFKSKLWEDSKYVSKQLDGIGPTLSTALVNAGLTSFEKIEERNPREIELIVNRHPPFGNQVKDSISKLPKYELVIEQVMKYSVSTAEIVITIQITNRDTLKDSRTTGHTCTLLVGDEDNTVLYRQRIMDALLLKEKSWSKKLEVRKAGKGPELSVHYISQDWVGLDVECTYTPNYLGGKRITSAHVGNQQNRGDTGAPCGSGITTNLPCLHTCHNKFTCAHDCCKHGVTSKRRNTSTQQTPRPASTKLVASHLQELKNRAANLPLTPSINKRMKLQDKGNTRVLDLMQFAYTTSRNNQAFINQDMVMSNDKYGVIGESSNDVCRTFKPRQQNYPQEMRYKNDWQELDMYAWQRQMYNHDDFDDQESLPDIQNTHQEITDANSISDNFQNEKTAACLEDDFAQETDYGYTYVTGGDRTEPPLPWDDRDSEQLCMGNTYMQDDKGYSNRGQGNSYSIQRLTKGIHDDLGRTNRTQRSYPNSNHFRSCKVYDKIQEGTDSHEKTKSDPGTKPLETLGRRGVNTEGRLNTGTSHDEITRRNNGKFASCNIDRLSRYVSPGQQGNTVNNDIPNVNNDRSFSRAGIMKSKGENTMPGTSQITSCIYDNDVEDDLENIEPELHVDLCNEDSETNPSKWTSYFSSQSSSASDNINWKYPARNSNNQVVMEKYNSLNTQNTLQQQQTSRKRFNTVDEGSNTNVGDRIRSKDGSLNHKYGQVLAWVSNSDNHHQDTSDEVIHEKQSNTSGLKSSESHPGKTDSFASIFDGIL